MKKQDLRKIIKESLEESFLGFGKNKDKEAKKAIEMVLEHFKEAHSQNLQSVKLFLTGEDVFGMPKLKTINDVFDAVEGTKCERYFKHFTDSLNNTYRDKLPDDAPVGGKLDIELGDYDFNFWPLEKCLGHSPNVETDEEIEEGDGRSQTIRRGKNKKPANYPWVRGDK